ncbi:MAG: C40 family peptidase [Bacteroidales bacterium]|nr:C40 family peptidase [Bacteroidales bacterium]
MSMRYVVMTLIAAGMAVTGFAQEKRMAVVELSTSYMRLKPDYESALETQELMGTVVEIVGEEGYWREIVSPQPYRAWATEKGLVEMSAEEIEAYYEAPKYMFTGLYGHVFSEPAEKSGTLCDLVGGDVLRMVWKDGTGKSEKALTKGKWAAVMLPSGRKGWVQKSLLKPLGERIDIRQGDSAEGLISAQKMEDIIASAMKLIGSPYLWGGMSAKGVDCSGLVRISCIMNDVLLPRNASQMVKCGMEVEISPLASLGRDDSMKATSNLRRGDLVFFGTAAAADKPMRVTHVGIYLGNNRIIHSSHMVRINSLIPGDEDHYENAHRLIAARRLVN